MTLQQPRGAQQAQNEPGAINAVAPKAGAPMSFADMVAKLQPAVVNISTTQHIKVQQQNPFAGTPFEDFRSEEHTSELQSLMRISYAVFCLKKKKHNRQKPVSTENQESKSLQ